MNKSEWIPCTDALPEEQKPVLVTIEECEARRTFVAYIYEGKWRSIVSKFPIGTMSRVIAWKPFPAPMEKDDEKK